MYGCPADFYYSKKHIWIKAEAESDPQMAMIGIAEELAEELGEILSIDLPMRGDELEIDVLCIYLHIFNHIRHLGSPLTGRVIEINKEVLDNPALLHLAPYKHWLFKMEYDEPDEFDLLMSKSQYSKYLDHL